MEKEINLNYTFHMEYYYQMEEFLPYSQDYIFLLSL